MADVQIGSDSANIVAVNLVEQGSDPTAPGSGHALLYVKGGVVYLRRNTGDPAAVGATSTLTQNRIGVGDASNLLSAMGAGSAGQILTSNGASAPTWEDAPEGGGGGDTLITTVTVPAGGQANIDIQSIPDTYWALRLWWAVRSERTGNWGDALYLLINNDTGSNYDRSNQGTGNYGQPLNVALAQASAVVGWAVGGDATANYFTMGHILIPWYASTAFIKTYQGITFSHHPADQSTIGATILAGDWRSTAAITRLTLQASGTNELAEGSVAKLFGVG